MAITLLRHAASPFLLPVLLAGARLSPAEAVDDGDNVTSADNVPVFSAAQRIVVTDHAMGARCAVAADLDGDGRADLVAASSNDNAVSWFRNLGRDAGTGALAFSGKNKITWSSLGSRIVAVADVDGDGDVDVINAAYYQTNLMWFENDGTGTFTPHLISDGVFEGQGVAAADLDNDGDVDVVSASSGDRTIAVFRNVDRGVFCEIKEVVDAEAEGARTVVAADLNGDGWLDLASASKDDDTVAWYPNDGTGYFREKIVVSRGEESQGAYSLVAEDIDGDGDQDLVVASNGNDHVSLWRNDGSGNFSKTLIYGEADFVLSVTAVDFDRDGDIDVASASFFDGHINWYENLDGLGYEWRNHTIYVGDQGHYVSHADVDGDGDDDLIAALHSDNTVEVFLAATECAAAANRSACCRTGTQWNNTACEACQAGSYGIGSGVDARCVGCPAGACTVPGLDTVPVTCAGTTGCNDPAASLARCSCREHHVRHPKTRECVACHEGMERPDSETERGLDSLGNYTLWEIEQGVCKVHLGLPDEHRTSQYLFVLGVMFFVVQALVAMSALGWTAWNRKSRIVRASQPEFLALVAIGGLVMSSAILPLNVEGKHMFEQDAAPESIRVTCMAVPWLLCTGIVLIYSALLGKLLRVKEVIDNALHFQTVEVRRIKVVKIIALFLTGMVTILATWQAVSPLKREVIDSVGRCTSDHDGAFVAWCTVFIVLCLGYALTLSWKTRNIATEYQESLYIILSVVFLFQLLLPGVPIMVVARNSAAYAVVFSLIIFSMSCGTTLLIFLPKVVALWQESTTPETAQSTMRRSSSLGRTVTRTNSVEEIRQRIERRNTAMSTQEGSR